MFPGGEGPDMQQLLQQAQQMQESLMSAQNELAETEVKGTAGGGLVTATVNGTGDLQGLEIKPEAYDPDDSEAMSTIADLVVAAVRDASHNAQELAASKLGPLSQGLGDFGNLGGGQPGGGPAGGAGAGGPSLPAGF